MGAETGPIGNAKEEEPAEYKGHNTAEESEEHELRTHEDKSPPEGWKDNSPPEALIEEKESQSTGAAEEAPEAPESLIEESESESTGAAHEEAAADAESEETEEDMVPDLSSEAEKQLRDAKEESVEEHSTASVEDADGVALLEEEEEEEEAEEDEESTSQKNTWSKNNRKSMRTKPNRSERLHRLIRLSLLTNGVEAGLVRQFFALVKK